MTYMPKIDRRFFVIGTAAAGAGLALGFDLAPSAEAADATPEVNAWVVINPDDSVVIRIAKSEMGQGTLTGLAQLTAEELGCDWSKVSTEFPTPGQNVARKRVWGDYFTAGSQGIRSSQELVRKGGAAARMMLIQAAADEWKVPAEECSAANSVITHAKTGRKTTFGKVASAAAKVDPPKDVTLKDPKTWTIAGKPLKRLDTPDKIVGKPLYGIDVRLPNMLYASIVACPVFGGKVTSYDEAKVHDMPGVKKIVKVGDNAVAVVADSWWRARKALDALPIVWDEGENVKVSSASIAQWLKEGLDADEAFVGNKVGDAKATLGGAAKVVEAVYSYPYQSHAPMEPMNATALYTADKCTVWCPTQNGESALAATAEAAGLPVGQCDVIKTYLGGGFGRRGQTDYVRQAVADRQGDARHAGQAVMDPRGGYHPRRLSSGHAVQDAGRIRRQEEPRRLAHADFRPVDPGVSTAGAAGERHGSGRVRPWTDAERAGGRVRLQHPEPAHRPCDAQSADPAGLLARRQPQP